MKKITILLVLVMAFFSCSDDSYNAPGAYTGSIAGRWKTIRSSKPGYEDINTSNCIDGNENGLYWTFIFNSDNSFTLYNTCSGVILETGMFTYYRGELFLDLDNTAAYITTNIVLQGGNSISLENYKKSNGETEGFRVILARQ